MQVHTTEKTKYLGRSRVERFVNKAPVPAYNVHGDLLSPESGGPHSVCTRAGSDRKIGHKSG